MIHREDFIKSIGEPDEGFNRAIDAAFLQIKEKEGDSIMKKKLTMTLAAAIITVLAMAGMAFAVGINVFDYFGKSDSRLNQLASQTVLETTETQKLESDDLGTVEAAFTNAYYDGQSMIAAFTMKNCDKYEIFEPEPEMLQRMEKIKSEDVAIYYDENMPDAKVMEAFIEETEQGNPCGYIHYSIYPADSCTVGDDVSISTWSQYNEMLEDGTMLYLREFESPMPEKALNQEYLDLSLELLKTTGYFYYDGEEWYELYEKAQQVGTVTAKVQRSEAIFRNFVGEGEYNGITVKVDAIVSAVRAEIKITANDNAFTYPEAEETWYDAILLDENGKSMRAEEIEFNKNDATLTFSGSGTIPEELTLHIGIRKGAWNEADFKAHTETIELLPVLLAK